MQMVVKYGDCVVFGRMLPSPRFSALPRQAALFRTSLGHTAISRNFTVRHSLYASKAKVRRWP